eukprot:s1096_g1.t1
MSGAGVCWDDVAPSIPTVAPSSCLLELDPFVDVVFWWAFHLSFLLGQYETKGKSPSDYLGAPSQSTFFSAHSREAPERNKCCVDRFRVFASEGGAEFLLAGAAVEDQIREELGAVKAEVSVDRELTKAKPPQPAWMEEGDLGLCHFMYANEEPSPPRTAVTDTTEWSAEVAGLRQELASLRGLQLNQAELHLQIESLKQELAAATAASTREVQRAVTAEALASRREQELSNATDATAKQESRAVAAETRAWQRDQEFLLPGIGRAVQRRGSRGQRGAASDRRRSFGIAARTGELSAAAEATAKEEQRAIAAEALASRREQELWQHELQSHALSCQLLLKPPRRRSCQLLLKPPRRRSSERSQPKPWHHGESRSCGSTNFKAELSAAAEATAKEEQRAIAAEALASRREQELWQLKELLLQERRAVAAEAVASRKEQELSITIEATSKEEVASTAQRSIEAEAAALRREQELSSSLELQVQRAAAAEELAKQRAQELSKAVDTATEQERRAATAEALANERLQELTAALDKVECEAQRARDAENLAAQRQQELLEAEAATAAQRNQSEDQKEEVAKLTSRLAEAEAQVAQIADLRAESASLREELASAKRTSSEQADKDAATQLELSSVREQVPKLQARIKELEEQLSHGALEAELAEERSRLEALQQELLLLRTASSQQADKEAATQLELSGLREQVSELQARIKDLEAENSESVALEAKTWEAKLQKELAAAKDVADEVSEAQRRDQEELRQRLASLEEELRSAVAAHRREVDRATAAEAATEESRRLSSQSIEEVTKLHTLLAEAEAKLLQLPAIAADASSLREALAEAQKERDLQVVAANRSALALAEVQQERDLQVAAANRTAQEFTCLYGVMTEALEELQKAELARQSAVSKQAAERAGLVAEVECAQEARQREMRQAADLAISLKQEQVHCTTLEAELVNQRSRMEDLQQELVRLRTASSQQAWPGC